MNETKSVGLRLPVQASVDRTATYATLADATGVGASNNTASQIASIAAQVLPWLATLF